MIEYRHLVGRDFEWGKHDCYSLVQEVYRENYNISLGDYERPLEGESEIPAFRENLRNEGFSTVDPSRNDYLPGDVFLMAINSVYGNHVGVLVEKDLVLHHMVHRLSAVNHINGFIRNTTVLVARHKDVPIDPPKYNQVDLMELLPETIKRKMQDAGAIKPSG